MIINLIIMKKLLLPFLLFIVTVTSQSQNIPLSNYGYYHNEGLDAYYSVHSGVTENECSAVIPELTKLLKDKYPDILKNLDPQEITTAFRGFNTKNFDIVSFWNSKKNNLYASQKITPKIGTLVEKILNENLSFEQTILEINNFKKSNSLTSDEKNALIVFESVLNSSNVYWRTNKKGKPGSQAIIADGLGALMFCYSGPGAIIAGMACSLFVNEAL